MIDLNDRNKLFLKLLWEISQITIIKKIPGLLEKFLNLLTTI